MPPVKISASKAAHLHNIAADSGANALSKQRERQGCLTITAVRRLLDIAIIVRDAGNAQQAGLVIQQLIQLLRRLPSCSASHGRIDGSISPLRVPIITPDCGVKPIEVLTERPPLIAQTLLPLPR